MICARLRVWHSKRHTIWGRHSATTFLPYKKEHALTMGRRRPLHRSGLLLLLIARRLMFALEHGNSWYHKASLINKRNLVMILWKPKLETVSRPWNHSRLIIHITHGKGYLSSIISYHRNSVFSFHLIRLFIGGDVCLNPGPDKCEICCRTITRNHRVLSYNVCNRSFHIKCQALTCQDFL